MARATTKQRKGAEPLPRGPRQRFVTQSRPEWLTAVAAAAALAAIAVVAALLTIRSGDNSASAAGLPRAAHYHSLLVAPESVNSLVLGTHEGLFRSTDGGRTWAKAELEGDDAMSLTQPDPNTIWVAGHDVLAKSPDGGVTWQDVRPSGLPSLDVHGFAADPRDSNRLYAAIAGQGLYSSTDAGRSFSLVSRVVGPDVMALAVLDDGTLLAGDMQRQVLAASSNGGDTWKDIVQEGIVGLAFNTARPGLVLASGPGVLRSTDGGQTWNQTLSLEAGSGPLAWSPSDPSVAYVVGLDRTLWRSGDFGAGWAQVVGAEG